MRINMSKTNNDKIVDWIVTKVNGEYKDDIALVLAYGSYINGTDNSLSDVDCYFIPKTKRGYQFATHFILNNIGYDIYPMAWKQVKNIVNLKGGFLPVVGDVKVLFYSKDNDLNKFHALQKRLHRNIGDDRRVEKVIKQKFVSACDVFSKMKIDACISDLRVYAGKILVTLAEIVALHNNEYFHHGLKMQYDELRKFNKIPDGFLDCYLDIIKAKEKNEIMLNCHNILNSISSYMRWQLKIASLKDNQIVEKRKVDADYQFLAGMYEEIVSMFNKVYVACNGGDYILAFLSAFCLQNELDELYKKQGIQKYYILNHYDFEDLSILATDTKNAEIDLLEIITKGGAKIKQYNTFEDFVKEN